MKRLFALLILLAPAPAAEAKVFEIFDGQFYNGLYYPLIDMIEWGEQHGERPHMEFHVHSKQRRLELTAVAGEKNGKPVLWLNIALPFRQETLCRHVLAPSHFQKGMKLYAYRDDRDPDFDNIYVSSEPVKGLPPYEMAPYAKCLDENASNMPDESFAEAAPVSAPAAATAPAVKAPRNIGVDYDNNAVPFSF